MAAGAALVGRRLLDQAAAVARVNLAWAETLLAQRAEPLVLTAV